MQYPEEFEINSSFIIATNSESFPTSSQACVSVCPFVCRVFLCLTYTHAGNIFGTLTCFGSMTSAIGNDSDRTTFSAAPHTQPDFKKSIYGRRVFNGEANTTVMFLLV